MMGCRQTYPLAGGSGQQPGNIPATPTSPRDYTGRRLNVLATALLMGMIRLYQLTLSPFIGGQCRFHPTCSNYAMDALASHGPLKGSWLALRRLLKCHPFHPGGFDPPPER